MKTILFCLLSLAIVFSSCKKKKIEEATIEPGAYFPVYPGSWWKYLVNGSDTISEGVSNGYFKSSFKGINGQSDEAYVPYFNHKPVYKYHKVDYIAPPFGDYHALWPILSETVGYQFERAWTDKRYGDFSEYVEVTDKYASGSDSVLVLEGHWVWGPHATHKSYQYYYKNVGLKSSVIIDTVTMDTIYRKTLIDYHINH